MTQGASFVYRIMEEKDVEPVLDMLAETFASHAPLEVALGITDLEFRQMVEFEMGPMIAERLSIVAVDPTEGTIVGMMAAQDAASPEPEGLSPTTSKYQPIADLCNPLHQACIEAGGGADGKLLYFFVMGVRSGYQGRGIVTQVIRETLKVAAGRGFERSCAITTGVAATRAFERLGFEEKGRTRYQDFVFQGQRPFLSIAEQGGAVVLVRDCVLGPIGR